MELKQLHTFRMAAQTLNFSRTAEDLNYAQSSVTSHIQALEAELKVPLFERIGKRLRLTEAGTKFQVYADQILMLAEEAKSVVQGGEEPGGILVIGAAESLCTYRLPRILTKFKESYPKVQLRFYPVNSDPGVRPLLANGTLDAAFILDRLWTSDTLLIEPLIEEPVSVIAHPSHPLAGKVAVLAADLTQESLLLTNEGCSYRSIFEDSLTSVGVVPVSLNEFTSLEAIKQCVISNMGIGVLPTMSVLQDLEQGKVRELQWKGCDFPVLTQIVTHKDKWLSPALAAFIQMAKDEYGK
ncbi:LysR family transcriptional regulator [Paenibacillus swuensis]|uniref:LysR family transcriptional regulator n=1 Tax=Paenibacillus swuensis TaxID=1178515 RepID=A0A172TMA0_9BACL|nr:LysR family transcriptional regulator [Paenibacillus swuensis]ANE48171.1 LysR family transcriptional regulator [Paenibacillus swuensis]